MGARHGGWLMWTWVKCADKQEKGLGRGVYVLKVDFSVARAARISAGWLCRTSLGVGNPSPILSSFQQRPFPLSASPGAWRPQAWALRGLGVTGVTGGTGGHGGAREEGLVTGPDLPLFTRLFTSQMCCQRPPAGTVRTSQEQAPWASASGPSGAGTRPFGSAASAHGHRQRPPLLQRPHLALQPLRPDRALGTLSRPTPFTGWLSRRRG